jgi:hypothetical protein
MGGGTTPGDGIRHETGREGTERPNASGRQPQKQKKQSVYSTLAVTGTVLLQTRKKRIWSGVSIPKPMLWVDPGRDRNQRGGEQVTSNLPGVLRKQHQGPRKDGTRLLAGIAL